MSSIQRLAILIGILQLLSIDIFAQAVPQGINYQGVLRDVNDHVLVNHNFNIEISIMSGSASGILEWQERHSTSTNQFGLFNIIIGNGTSTGMGAAGGFNLIRWEDTLHYAEILVDINNSGLYLSADTLLFYSVPYAFYSQTAGVLKNPITLEDLIDVDTTGVAPGMTIYWDGLQWKPYQIDCPDSVSFSVNSVYAVNSDTSQYALFLLNYPDTVLFSSYSDTAHFSNYSDYADSAYTSNYCDTAQYAYVCGNLLPSWLLGGNVGLNSATNFLGTLDSTDLVIKTNNLERMRITANGNLGVGISTPVSEVHISGNKGLIAAGTFGTGVPLPVSGAGTRMLWYPARSAFRVGTVTGAQWDIINIGNYSFAGGYNCNARGNYSFAMGQQSTVYSDNSAAIGFGNIAQGNSSIAMGSVCQANGPYSIALGRAAIATDSVSICIGYHSWATGKNSTAFGYQTTASGDYSLSMGYEANTNGKKGSFVFADASSLSPTYATADNQFLVRASGGYIFYSNTGLTSGVSIAPGGGSWTTLSDRNAKQNIRQVNGEDVLAGYTKLRIYSWNYKTQSPTIRHIGPMAQDLYSIFNFGESDTTISMVDADGLNFAAIKELIIKTEKLEEKEVEIAQLKQLLQEARTNNEALEERIKAIEQYLLSLEQK